MGSEYVADRLHARLFMPWTLNASEWPLAKEDWIRVNAIASLPWKGDVLDYGCGDGTLGAMVCSKNPGTFVHGFDLDAEQVRKARVLWEGWPAKFSHIMKLQHVLPHHFSGALLCEVLEHLLPAKASQVLKRIREVLVPGGMLCVTIPSADGKRAAYPGHINLMETEDLYGILQDEGFKVMEYRSICKTAINAAPTWHLVVAENHA